MRAIDDLDSIEQMMEFFGVGKPGFIHYPLEMKLASFGLDPEEIKKLKDKKTLEIGCGKNAEMVRYLSEREVLAEGIDPEISESAENLIAQTINCIHPLSGSIPRPNEHYDACFSYSTPPVGVAFSTIVEGFRQTKLNSPTRKRLYTEIEQDLQRHAYEGNLIMIEALRVLKRGGKLSVFPDLDRLDISALCFQDRRRYLIEHVEVDALKEAATHFENDPNLKEIRRMMGIDRLPEILTRRTEVYTM